MELGSPARLTGRLAIALLIAVIGVGPLLLGVANPDVGWLVYVGRELLGGADVYTDLVESNPPLAVWLTIPAHLVASAVPLTALDTFNVLAALGAVGVLIYLHRILMDSVSSDRGRNVFFFVAAIVILVGPGLAFAQREHLAVILTLPYLLAAALRSSGDTDTRFSAVGRGLLAGVGFALKPHFLLIPVTAEAWRWWRHRSTYRLIRPDTTAMGGFLLAYAGSVLFFEPDYFAVLFDLVIPYYPHANPRTWLAGLTSKGALTACAALLGAYLAGRNRRRHDPIAMLFGLLSLVWLLIAVVQRQALGYHYLPAVLYSVLTLGASLIRPSVDSEQTGGGTSKARRGRTGSSSVGGFAAGVVLFSILTIFVVRNVGEFGWIKSQSGAAYERLVEIVREAGGGSPVVAALNLDFWPSFPLVNDTGARWAPRYPFIWLIVASRNRAGSADAETEAPSGTLLEPLSRREAEFREEYLQRLLRSRPDVLLIPTHEAGQRSLDVFEYFMRDERFADFLSGYEREGELLQHWVWVRGNSVGASGGS